MKTKMFGIVGALVVVLAALVVWGFVGTIPQHFVTVGVGVCSGFDPATAELENPDAYKVRNLICLVDEEFDPANDLILTDPKETWKKTKLKGGTYDMRELLQPIFLNGECVYESPTVMEMRDVCTREKESLWDETKRFVNPHEMYVDLSDKLFKLKSELLEEMSMKQLMELE